MSIEHKILESGFVSKIKQKSRRIKLPGFKGLSLYEVFDFFVHQIQREGLNVRAAAISFNIIMAIPAASLFLFTLIPYIPGATNMHKQLLQLVHDFAPNSEAQVTLTQFLDDFFNKPKTGLLSLGFFLALFYASNAMMGIIRTFDRSLMKKAKTNFLKKRLRALKLTVIMVLLIIGTTLILTGQGVFFNRIMEWMKIENNTVRTLIQNLRWLVVIALFLYSIAFIYKFAPSIHKRWKLISPGSILATGLMITCTYFFSIWASNFSNYNRFYGSIGTLLLIMALVFINSLVLLVGFELDFSIYYLSSEDEEQQRLKNTMTDPAL